MAIARLTLFAVVTMEVEARDSPPIVYNTPTSLTELEAAATLYTLGISKGASKPPSKKSKKRAAKRRKVAADRKKRDELQQKVSGAPKECVNPSSKPIGGIDFLPTLRELQNASSPEYNEFVYGGFSFWKMVGNLDCNSADESYYALKDIEGKGSGLIAAK